MLSSAFSAYLKAIKEINFVRLWQYMYCGERDDLQLEGAEPAQFRDAVSGVLTPSSNNPCTGEVKEMWSKNQMFCTQVQRR